MLQRLILGLASLCFIFIAIQCNKDNPDDADHQSAPIVVINNPLNNSENVSVNEIVFVSYDKDIALNKNIKITANDQSVDATVNGKKLILDFDKSPDSLYVIEIPEGAVMAQNGKASGHHTFSFRTVKDGSSGSGNRFEAEDAVLAGGATVESNLTGFSGNGYVNQQNGQLSFTVPVTTEGAYKLTVRYTNNQSYKENELVVNGQSVVSMKFNATSQWADYKVNKIILQSGNNTIQIKAQWGYTFYDYIEIGQSEPDVAWKIAPQLSNLNATQATKNVYNYLLDQFGKRTLSGAMANYTTGLEEAIWIESQTGKWPALAGFDLINHTRTWDVGVQSRLQMNAEAWWQSHGLVSVMWHWRDPMRLTDEFYTDKTNFNPSGVFDPQSPEYEAMIRDIDTIANALKLLQDKGIPVLWRPLHEASGQWFWWGRNGPEACKALYILIYDRLTNHHGLNNLIWVWTTDSADDATDWYPGDDYVDILGMDIYPGEGNHASQYINFDKVRNAFGGKKLITLSECGSIPRPDDMFKYGDTWSWFMPWNGNFTRSSAHNGTAYLIEIMAHPNVITRDEVPDLKG